MSIDWKIQNKCDHVINWEVLPIESDNRTIYVTYVVASTASFQLRIDNVLLLPSMYEVSRVKDAIPTQSPYYVYLKEKNRHFEPIIEAKYTTISSYCPKCAGIKTIDDHIYSSHGDVVTTDTEALLIQNVEKYIVTRVGSNTFHDWVGTELQDLIGIKIVDFNLVQSKITEQVLAAIDKLRAVQDQLVSIGRSMSSGELFGELLSIDVEQAEDPTLVYVTVTFTAQSGRTLQYSQFLELSGLVNRRTF